MDYLQVLCRFMALSGAIDADLPEETRKALRKARGEYALKVLLAEQGLGARQDPGAFLHGVDLPDWRPELGAPTAPPLHHSRADD